MKMKMKKKLQNQLNNISVTRKRFYKITYVTNICVKTVLSWQFIQKYFMTPFIKI